MEKKQILIVEDDRDLRQLYAEVLRDAGFSVDEATDGQVGREILGQKRFDLVLLDIMLPKIDGLEVLQWIRSQQRLEGVKVVLLTNLDRESIVKEGFEVGADGYIIKSEIDPGMLVDEVNAGLGGE